MDLEDAIFLKIIQLLFSNYTMHAAEADTNQGPWRSLRKEFKY
jgi:hypothetical protein